MYPINEYERKKQARIDRYLDKAEQARAESSSLSQKASDMLSAIPPGQPMLVDHYSNKRDKRYRERIGQTMDKAIAADQKAAYYEKKATAVERNTAISADDPEAITKLSKKLERLKGTQTFMKAVNAYYRKHQTAHGCEGVDAKMAAAIDDKMASACDWETAPFASYQLSNLNQEIHRLEKRINQLTQAKEEGFQGWEFDGGKVVANSEKNRLQIFFDSIPPEEVRSDLKGHGFRWARSEGAWQRQLSQNALYSCRHIKAIQPLDGSNPVKIQPRKKNSPQR